MKEQVDKVFGLIVLGVAGLIGVAFGLVFHVLPAFLMLSLFSAAISAVIFFITVQIFNFQLLWLIVTIILVLAINFPFDKVERAIRNIVAKDEEK